MGEDCFACLAPGDGQDRRVGSRRRGLPSDPRRRRRPGQRDALQRARDLSGRIADREERHYSVSALRWITTLFARRGLKADVARSTELLSQTAGTLGTVEAVAGLGHALGELALADGDAAGAAQQFTYALDLLGDLGGRPAEPRSSACSRAAVPERVPRIVVPQPWRVQSVASTSSCRCSRPSRRTAAASRRVLPRRSLSARAV
jgi:hypothetical protein